MVQTPGYCSRKTACRIAAVGAPVRVPLDSAFICPECGCPLTPPALDEIRSLSRRPVYLAAAIAAAALLVGTAVLARTGFFSRAKPVPVEAPITLSVPAATTGHPVDIVPDTLLLVRPVTVEAAQTPAPSHAERVAVLAPPADRRAAPRKQAAARHHANVHLSFSIPLVAGGQPDYPDQYQDGQSGIVTINCALSADGIPRNCATLRRSGGPIFDVAVHSWLDLKDVRFKPVRIRGHAIDHVTVKVEFIGEPALP